ncbi:MAG: hypothetical protein LBD22_02375 [Spirochaetaceae bacterium]|nr:hypothetical protein [Spirochaetaceae bacterium]
MEAWQDTLYQKTLNEELTGLERRRAADFSCTVEALEELLESLYNLDGADWLGRGEVQSITLSAQIAAYEQFISAWKKESCTTTGKKL